LGGNLKNVITKFVLLDIEELFVTINLKKIINTLGPVYT
jgi:hypothetical protein